MTLRDNLEEVHKRTAISRKDGDSAVDGDVLNIIALKITSLADEYYRKLNPVNNIFISRNDGKYNADATLFKDQAISLYAFANI